MSKTYYKRYELLHDTPTHKAGWPLRWDGTRRKYFFVKASTIPSDKGKPDIYRDYNGQSFTIEEVESKPDWFKPIGEATDFVPAFPNRQEIEEYVHLDFETKLVDDVDICRAMNDLFSSREFQDELYLWVKLKYEQFHATEGES